MLNKVEKIDIDFYTALVEEIIKEYKEEEIRVFPAGYNKSIYYKIYKLFPLMIREKIIIPIYLASKHKKRSHYFPSGYSRIMALDFLYYIIKNHPKFELKYFNQEDKKTIIKFLKNIFYFALLDKVKKENIFTREDLEIAEEYHKLSNSIKKKGKTYTLDYNNKKYLFPIQNIETSLFYHKYNLNLLPEEVMKKINRTDFIDAGAYIGDSAIVLNHFNPLRIYAFEPIHENFSKLLKTIKMNNLKNIMAVKKGLGKNSGRAKLIGKDIISFIDESGTEETEIIKLDDFARENKLNIGLIKLDIEGFELELLNGAKETIKKFKPVLLISVYHTGKDFFEIPLFLKKLTNYRFRFFDLNHEYPTNDKMLIAY